MMAEINGVWLNGCRKYAQTVSTMTKIIRTITKSSTETPWNNAKSIALPCGGHAENGFSQRRRDAKKTLEKFYYVVVNLNTG